MAMTKKEKAELADLRARVTKADAIADRARDLAAYLLELMREDVEQIARDAANEVCDNLSISR
jgi:hypothetical protein